MKTAELLKQLELYSNAIVAFVVAQSLTFAFTFGTNIAFACTVISVKALALGLLMHFMVSSGLAMVAISYLGRAIQHLSKENRNLVRVLFIAKSVVVFIFAIIPILVLLWFGVISGDEAGRCAPEAKLNLQAPGKTDTNPPVPR